MLLSLQGEYRSRDAEFTFKQATLIKQGEDRERRRGRKHGKNLFVSMLQFLDLGG